jgi:hypothetical protein
VTVFYLGGKDYLSKGWFLFDAVLAFWGFVAFWRAVADDTAAKHIAIPLVIRLSHACRSMPLQLHCCRTVNPNPNVAA